MLLINTLLKHIFGSQTEANSSEDFIDYEQAM